MSVGLYRGQKKALVFLDLESQTIGSHLTWVMETRFQSSAQAASAGSAYTVYLVPQYLNYHHHSYYYSA